MKRNVDTVIISSRSSTLAALTSPVRWGLERVLYSVTAEGQVWNTANSQIVLAGDKMRDLETGELMNFVSREGGKLNATSDDYELITIELVS